MLLSAIKKIISYLIDYRRERYKHKKRLRNKNKTPTIISNNCIGGIMYHDLGLEFMSPTINLYFNNEDFFTFVNDIEYYINQVPYEVFEEGVSFPIGEIRKEDESVRLYFMHYKNFDDAVESWKRRAKRVNYDNLFIVFSDSPKIKKTDEIYKKFKNIKYTNKRMITNPIDFEDEEIVKSDLFEKNHHPGQIMKYKSKVSKKRYLDDFDYVAFLNNK